MEIIGKGMFGVSLRCSAGLTVRLIVAVGWLNTRLKFPAESFVSLPNIMLLLVTIKTFLFYVDRGPFTTGIYYLDRIQM